MMRYLLAACSLILAACGGTDVTTTEALVASTASPTTATPTTTAEPATSAAPPLVAGGCDTFDAERLTELSPVTNQVALIENTASADRLVCNFVGVSDGLDTGIRVEIERVADQPPGHYTVAGEFESELELAGKRGVGFGRGNVRLQLDDSRGLTLTVTIRSLSADAAIPSDGEYLEIRDAIASYLVTALD